jgi:hypothetical protein
MKNGRQADLQEADSAHGTIHKNGHSAGVKQGWQVRGETPAEPIRQPVISPPVAATPWVPSCGLGKEAGF